MHETARQVADAVKDSGAWHAAHYWWVLVISAFGGVVRVVKEHKLGEKTLKQILILFAVEITISCFVGFNTFVFCKAIGLVESYTVLMTCIGAYMGGRAIGAFEAMYNALIRKGPQ